MYSGCEEQSKQISIFQILKIFKSPKMDHWMKHGTLHKEPSNTDKKEEKSSASNILLDPPTVVLPKHKIDVINAYITDNN